MGPRDRLDYLEQRKIYCPVVIRTSNRPECSLVSVPMLHKNILREMQNFKLIFLIAWVIRITFKDVVIHTSIL